MKLKPTTVVLNKEKYPLPLTYVTPIITDNLQFVLGMNLIHSFKGGINICQGVITFYRKIDIIQTSLVVKRVIGSISSPEKEEIPMLLEEEDFL